MNPSSYSVFVILAILISAWCWRRRAKNQPFLPLIYIGGLLGALLGAKLAFVVGELWAHKGSDEWFKQVLAGKSILGALLGGYAGVEWMKKCLGITQWTGDWFAAFVPLSISVGRVGCLMHGCCQGSDISLPWLGNVTWPAVEVEIGFNFLAVLLFWVLRKRNALTGQHFHLYLMAYGVFRFFHEFVRASPKFGWLSGYQVIALCLLVFGGCAYAKRRKVILSRRDQRASVLSCVRQN
jgi:phosphatidylglycerol---prolipoprotein diacylglyceryl transferase